ncbi:MAG: hypothetical protein ACREQA_12095, partial [Candidatus Binatia bacterium]
IAVLALALVALQESITVGLVRAAGVKAPWQVEWEKTLEGAKKEGELRLWGDMEITHPDIVAAFSREYPLIRVVAVTGKVGELMPRIIAERRAGNFDGSNPKNGNGRSWRGEHPDPTASR